MIAYRADAAGRAALAGNAPEPDELRVQNHRRGVALQAAADAFLHAMESLGFTVAFPDEVRVPAEWFAQLLTMVEPIPNGGIEDATTYTDARKIKAALYDQILAHVRALNTTGSRHVT
jgi:hypothetical protein